MKCFFSKNIKLRLSLFFFFELFSREGMNDKVQLFKTVFTRLTETLSSHIRNAIIDFHNQIPLSGQSNFFDLFPRSSQQYILVIRSVSKLSEVDPQNIIEYLSDLFLNKRQPNCPIISELHEKSIPIKFKTVESEDFFSIFLHFFFVDLLSPIVITHKIESMKLIECIESLFSEKPLYKYSIFIQIIKQWSVIFAFQKMDQIIYLFDKYSSSSQSFQLDLAFTLIRFLRLETFDSGPFLNKLITNLKTLFKKHLITLTILRSLSELFLSNTTHEDQLNSLFDFCSTLRKEKQLKDGIYELQASILLHTRKKDIPQFYKKRVFAHVGDPNKVKRALLLFQRQMFGLEINSDRFCFESNIVSVSNPLCCIHWNSEPERKMSDPDSFASQFMKQFFIKSDFSACPELFSQVIIHLASLDFTYFNETILPQFMKLQVTDTRFLSFLMSLPMINSEDFFLNSFTEPREDELEKYDEEVRQKVCNSFASIFAGLPQEYGILNDSDNSIIEESDRKMAQLLPNISPTEVHLTKCHKNPADFVLPIAALKCIPFILKDSDFIKPDILEHLISYCYNANYDIATSAMDAIKHFSTKYECRVHLIFRILASLSDNDIIQNSLLTLILDIIEECDSLNQEIVAEIESKGYIYFTSPIPATRILAWNILKITNTLSDNHGIMSSIVENKTQIEMNVSHRLGVMIDFDTARLSHFFNVWLIFISEMTNVLRNNTGLMSRINLVTPKTPGVLILYSYANSTKPQKFIDAIIEYPNNNSLFFALPYCDFKLFPHIVLAIPFPVKDDNLKSSTEKVLQMLKSCTSSVLKMLKSPHISEVDIFLPSLVNFLAVLQGTTIQLDTNGPGRVLWTDQNEKKVIQNEGFLIDYLEIIHLVFQNASEGESKKVWPYANRSLVFQFILNWGMTKSPQLEQLRKHSLRALASIVKVGPFFKDVSLFNSQTLEFLGNAGKTVVSLLLKHHSDICLSLFIDACFTQPIPIGDIYFQAILSLLQESPNIECIYDFSGELLLLGLVYKELENPHSQAFVTQIASTILQNKTALKYFPNAKHQKNQRNEASQSNQQNENREVAANPSLYPKKYRICTEKFLETALEFIKKKELVVSIKDICEAIRPWILLIRILPKQKYLIPGTPSQFAAYTPFSFLEALMLATVQANEKSPEDFRYVALLWTDLMHCPDHSELIPLFIAEYQVSSIKQKLFLHLIYNDAPNAVKRLALHCTFAYYFHVTRGMLKKFDDELWIVPLLVKAVEIDSPEINSNIITILHFAFLYKCNDLISALSEKLNIGISFNSLLSNLNYTFESTSSSVVLLLKYFTKIIDRFIEKLDVSSLKQWGLEATKWILASQNLEYAYVSIYVYNRIKDPQDPLIVKGICKSVRYHLMNYIHGKNDKDLLDKFVGESFVFYDWVFNNNEVYSYSFLSSFFDCSFFFNALLENSYPLYQKALNSFHTNQAAWDNLTGFIRPLLKNIETNENSQSIVNYLIELSGSNELKLVVYPIKNIRPQLFPASKLTRKEIEKVSLSILCKVLVHYSCMIDTTAPIFLDEILATINLFLPSVANHNNKEPLYKIYIKALDNISMCPSSIEFIIRLFDLFPNILTDSFEFYDWNRSIEDVSRSLGHLVDDYNIPVTNLTDCSTLSSVINLLDCEVVPKILPFETQKETIEAMFRAQNEVQLRSNSFRKNGRRSTSRIFSFHLNYVSPLPLPESVNNNHETFQFEDRVNLIQSPDDFLESMMNNNAVSA